MRPCLCRHDSHGAPVVPGLQPQEEVTHGHRVEASISCHVWGGEDEWVTLGGAGEHRDVCQLVASSQASLAGRQDRAGAGQRAWTIWSQVCSHWAPRGVSVWPWAEHVGVHRARAWGSTLFWGQWRNHLPPQPDSLGGLWGSHGFLWMQDDPWLPWEPQAASSLMFLAL